VIQERHNRFEMTLHAPRGVYFDEESRRYTSPPGYIPPDDAIGAEIFAQNNLFTLSSFGKRQPGRDLVFEADACNNRATLLNLPNGLTSRATLPTNRVVPLWNDGLKITTPPVPVSGQALINETCYPVEVFILQPGVVRQWVLADAQRRTMRFDAGFFVGQCIRVEPGDGITLVYDTAPVWQWNRAVSSCEYPA